MTQRDRMVVGVLVAVAALAGFWFLVLGSKRSESSHLGEQIAAQRTRIDAAHTQLQTYKAARAGYRANYATVARLGKAVPVDDDVPSLVYQIESAANRSGVNFRKVQVSAGASSATAPPPPAAPGAATATAAATLPPGASVGSAGFPTMPFTFTFDGNFFRLSDFFAHLERFIVASNKRLLVSGRLLTIDGIGLAPAASGFPRMTASVTATSYLLPADQGLSNGASPSSPTPAAGTATPAATTTPGSSAVPPAAASSVAAGAVR
jgi:hypothetical protein